MTQIFKNAFNCRKCPGRNDELGCPMWWETMWRDGEEIKTVKSCGYSQMPMFLMETSRSANHAASSFDKLTNVMNTHLVNICTAVKTSLEAMQIVTSDRAHKSQGELIDGR